MTQSFYSNGKLLITGEYVVLDGAQALALPTKFGQNLIVSPGKNKKVLWKSYDSDGSIWFESNITFESIFSKEVFEEDSIKTTLIEILHHTQLLNPSFLNESDGYEIRTELTFPKFWGLGTSSTLINNIAQWQKIDAFTLLKNSFGGSGYDVACAQYNSPIVYELQNEKPIISEIKFNPSFIDKIHFVYLNKKQSSKIAITNYYNKQGNIQKTIPIINKITQTVIESIEPKDFALALQQHEIELSNILEMQTVKEALFYDFKGTIKSLGAWGGDFVLAIAKENPTNYFKEKGYPIVIPYSEMIL
jgi:mevalonate kinase